MPVPLQLTARDVSLSQAAEEEIRAKATNLETYDDRLTGCRVVVKGPGRHHRQGPYRVRIDLSVPGAELVDRQADADLAVAIRDAFDAVPCRKTECGEVGLTYDGIPAGCTAHHVGGVLIVVLTRQLGRHVLYGAGVIHAHDVEHLLGNVDPHYPKILFHRTRLLWSHNGTWR